MGSNAAFADYINCQSRFIQYIYIADIVLLLLLCNIRSFDIRDGHFPVAHHCRFRDLRDKNSVVGPSDKYYSITARTHCDEAIALYILKWKFNFERSALGVFCNPNVVRLCNM